MKRPKVALILLVTLFACADESTVERGIVVSAPDSYLGARVLIDGQDVGSLEHLASHGSTFEKVLKLVYGDNPAFRVVAIVVDFGGDTMSNGTHTLEVVGPENVHAVGQFDYPLAEDIETYFVNGSKIEGVEEAPSN